MIERQRTHVTDAEAETVASPLQHRVVALAVAPELEVVAHHEVAHAEQIDQEPLDHLVRRDQTRTLVERDAQHPVDPRLAQQVDLLPEPGQPRRRRRVLEVLARLRLEGDQHAWRTQFATLGRQMREQHLVAVVHTVERPDGRHAPRVTRPDVVQTADDLHTGGVYYTTVVSTALGSATNVPVRAAMCRPCIGST